MVYDYVRGCKWNFADSNSVSAFEFNDYMGKNYPRSTDIGMYDNITYLFGVVD